MTNKQEIVEWFNVQSDEHLAAYRILEQSGLWPEGFIPEEVSLSPGWHMQLMWKMASACLDYKAAIKPSNPVAKIN